MALRPTSSEDPKDKTAKREAAQQDALLREVDDALRQDEVSGFFKAYGIPLMVIVVLGLAALGGYLWWQGRQDEVAGLRGEKMIVAIDEIEAGNLKAADEHLAAIAAENGTASAVAATLMRAGIAIEDGRKADAIKLYAEVATDEDAPQPYRDLATVRGTAAAFDNMEPQKVIDRLKPLAVPGNPWFGVAGELVGMAYLKQDKEDLAGPLFAKIANDEDLPDSLRARARQLAGLLGVDAIEDVIGEDGDKDAESEAGETADDEGAE